MWLRVQDSHVPALFLLRLRCCYALAREGLWRPHAFALCCLIFYFLSYFLFFVVSSIGS